MSDKNIFFLQLIFLIILSSFLGIFFLDNYQAFSRYFYFSKISILILFIYLLNFLRINKYLYLLIIFILSVYLLFFINYYYQNMVDNFSSNKSDYVKNYFNGIEAPTRVFYYKQPENTWDTRYAVLQNIFNPNIFAYDLCVTGYCKNIFGLESFNDTKKIESFLKDKKLMDYGKPSKNDFYNFYNLVKNDINYQILFYNFVKQYAKTYEIDHLVSKNDIMSDPLFFQFKKNLYLLDTYEIKKRKSKEIYYLFKLDIND